MDLLEFAHWFAIEPLDQWGPWDTSRSTSTCRWGQCQHPNDLWLSYTQISSLASFYWSKDGTFWEHIASIPLGPGCPLTQLQTRFDFSKTTPVCNALERWLLKQACVGRVLISWNDDHDTRELDIQGDKVDLATFPQTLLQSLHDLQDLLLPQAGDQHHEPYTFAPHHLLLSLPPSHHARLQRLQTLLEIQ